MVTTRSRKAVTAPKPHIAATTIDHVEILDCDEGDDLANARKARRVPVKRYVSTKKPSPKKKNVSVANDHDKSEGHNESFFSDSSDSDDDIAKQLEAVRKRPVQRPQKYDDSSSDDDNDSDKCSDGGKTDSDGSSSNEEAGVARPGNGGLKFAARNNRLKLQRATKTAVGGNGDDSDSDSEVEVLKYVKVIQKPPKKWIESIDCSSDEDDKPKISTGLKVGDAFSMARAMLESAQAYHAEEMEEVALPEPNSTIVIIDADSPTADKTGAAVHRNQGALIMVKLRRDKEEDIFQIRTLAPLETLLDNYMGKKNISRANRAKISFRFDGEKLNLSFTPADLDMEDDELIDVFMKN